MGQTNTAPISLESASSERPVILYTYPNYQSAPTVINYGKYPTMSTAGFQDDSLNSIKVAAFTKVTCYEDQNYVGRYVTFIGPVEATTVTDYRTSSIIVERIIPAQDQIIACCSGQLSARECDPYLAGSGTCAKATLDYCTNNMDKAICQSWARANQNIADPIVNAFCKVNSSAPFCSCINSKATGLGINPKCVDKACLDTGYLTANMQSTLCPSIVTCNVYADLQNSGMSLVQSIPVSQNCGNTTTPPIVIPASNPANVPQIIDSTGPSYIIWAFLILLTFVILGAAAIYIFSDDIFGPDLDV